jgi:dienelactone hydrolase
MAGATVALTLMTATAYASGTADLRCNEFLTALQSNDFAAATSHFDATMKAGLGPDKLASTWNAMVASNGKLLGWEITQHANVSVQEIVLAPLKFERTSALAAQVAVNTETSQISGLYWVDAPSAAPSPVAATSPPYAIAGNFYSLDVHVGSAPLELPGILTIPTNGKGPWPAVAMLGGSGPNDMDETIGPNHIFTDIAEGLSSRGIVVLRYSKRTLIYGKQMDLQHTTIKEEYLDDAVAAVNLLRSRSEVAKDRIFIAGHSLGATVAPEVALRAAPVQGLILLAPSGRQFGESVVQQMRFLGEASHQQLDEIERKANELDKHQMPATENFMGMPASYFYSLDAINEVATARQLGIPILILHGGRDWQVIDKDIEHWQEGLKGVAHVHIDTFPALNHLFIAGTGKPNAQEYNIPSHVDQQVIDAMSSFIENPLAN